MRALLVVAAMLATAAPAAAQGLKAPGRVVMPSLGWEVEGTPDAGGGGPSVMLDDGSALLLADYDGHGRALVRLRRDGSIEQRPPLQLPEAARALPAHNMVRDLQGRILLVLTRRRPGRTAEFDPLFVVRLSADGQVDRSFGADGLADPGINLGCGSCDDVAAGPDGSVVLTGTLGGTFPARPGGPSGHRWVVAKLTPTGQRDPAFSDDGVTTLPPANAFGFNVAVLPDGRIAVLGQESLPDFGSRMLLGRLTPAGALDPAYHGGSPVETPFASSFQWLVRGDGTVWLEGGRPVARSPLPSALVQERFIVRFTASGELDRGFGSDGMASLGTIRPVRLLPEPGDAVLVLATPQGASGPATPIHGTVVWARVGAAGNVASPGQRVTPSFGGGVQSANGSLAQNSFFLRAIHRRPDGSFLLVGGVSVVIYTGEGAGRSAGGSAYASLTPAFAPDTSFGGVATRPRVRVSVPRQRASTVRRRRRVAVILDAERPSLTQVEVRTRRGLVARQLIATLRPGRARHRLSIRRSRLSRVRRGLRLTVRARVRDLVRTTATATARRRLR